MIKNCIVQWIKQRKLHIKISFYHKLNVYKIIQLSFV